MADKKAIIDGIGNKLLWNLSYKHRRILIPVLIGLIVLASAALAKQYFNMESRLNELSSYEPIYVLSTKRDLNVGDVIGARDIEASLYYKKEFQKKKFTPRDGDGEQKALISCDYDPKRDEISNYEPIIGRVVRVPILKGSFIRKDYLAERGALPGLKNLIAKDHSLLDVEVEQIGFNIFIKPGDKVDLYNISRSGTSELITRDMEVILVDSLPLGQAPFQVGVSPGKYRNLTLAAPNGIIKKAIQAQKQSNLAVTYNHADLGPGEVFAGRPGFFQSLTFIEGGSRTIFGR